MFHVMLELVLIAVCICFLKADVDVRFLIFACSMYLGMVIRHAAEERNEK